MAVGYNYVKTHSDVWFLGWMTPQLGSDGTIALRTYAWPLHVFWASSQRGSFRVPGLFTWLLRVLRDHLPVNKAKAEWPFGSHMVSLSPYSIG